MKRLAISLLLLLLALPASADELMRRVQTKLKDQGFYYGEITGVNGPETVAAVKRYQIRNGFNVTGSLTGETLTALGVSDAGPTAPTAPVRPSKGTVPAPPPTVQQKQPTHLRRGETVNERDRAFLEREARSPREQVRDAVAAPAPLDPPADPGADRFVDLFAGTPYANASLEVQQSILRRAQSILAREGLYHEVIDGFPGPETEEAVLIYQRRAQLTLTGRLDSATLDELHLLPARRAGPTSQPFRVPPGSKSPTRLYRGIWIN